MNKWQYKKKQNGNIYMSPLPRADSQKIILFHLTAKFHYFWLNGKYSRTPV